MTIPHDPYLDPSTGILRNRVGAATADELRLAEAELVSSRLVQLGERYPVRAGGDLDEVRGIHRHLFQDVYGWAGELRTVDIRRPGREPFLPFPQIPTAAGYTLGQLAEENFLHGLDRGRFVQRLAGFYDELNYIHPFREGNGRTQRVFWSRVAGDAGWSLDWTRASGEQNDAASRAAAEQRDLDPLRAMLDRVVADRAQPGGGSSAVDLARIAFPDPARGTGAAPSKDRPPTRRRGRGPGRAPGVEI